MQASIRSEEDERMRIAAELHDDVGASLSSVRLYLHQAVQNPDNAELVAQTKHLLDDTIQKVRNLSHQLQPGTLQYLGLSKSLQSLAELLSRSKQIDIQMLATPRQWQDPPDERALSIYRIVQELINNVIKHANAGSIEINLHFQNQDQCITLTHNGKGLTQDDYDEYLYKKGAIGLKNIEHRIKSAGLSLSFHESAEGLFAISICIPPIATEVEQS